MSVTEKLVAEYADALTATPTSVDADLRARIAATFTRKQAVELTHLIAWENARARFNRGFDIQPDGYTPDPDAGVGSENGDVGRR